MLATKGKETLTTVSNQVSVERRMRIYLAGFAFILFFVIVIGVFIYLTNPHMAAGVTLSYIAGLSTIFLPCTLPLAFIVAPIAMSESPRKGIAMALSFGAGMMITSGIYGIAIAYIGDIDGLLTANAIAGIVGGGLAYVFGLSALGLIKIPKLGSVSSDFIKKQGDYLKIFFIGLLLAKVDMYCPNPIFYVLLAHVTGMADIFTGWSVMAAYGTGKATAMIFLVILGILGINATPGIKKRIGSIEKATDWGLVFVGAFLLTLAEPFRNWYDHSPLHEYWNNILITLTDGRIGEVETLNPEMDTLLEKVPQWLGPYIFILLLAMPLVLIFYKKKTEGWRLTQRDVVMKKYFMRQGLGSHKPLNPAVVKHKVIRSLSKNPPS